MVVCVQFVERYVQYTRGNRVSSRLNENNSALNEITVILSPVVKAQPTAFQELLAWVKTNKGRAYREIERQSGGAVTFSNIANLVAAGKSANPQLDTINALAKGMGVPASVVVDALNGIRMGESPNLKSKVLRETLAQYEALEKEGRHADLKVFIESLTTAVQSAFDQMTKTRL